MFANGAINKFQFCLLVINFTIGSALLLIPSAVVTHSKHDAWISMILAMLVGSIIIFILGTLASKYPDKTIIQITETLLGKYVGKFVGLLYAWFYLHLAALVIRNLTDFLKVFMIDTPIEVFNIMIGILMFFAIKYGLEVIARSNEIYTIMAFIGVFFTFLLVIPLMDIDNIKPILAHGIKPVLSGSLPAIGFPYAELVVFLMIIPAVNNKRHLKKIFILGGILGGIVLFFSIIGSILVLGEAATSISVYPTYNMARLINVGDFLTRVEAFISLSFFIIVFVKIIIAFYASILAVTQVFNMEDFRPLTIPYIIISLTLSVLLNENIVEVINFASSTWTPYAMVFGFLFPLFLLLLTFIKKDKHTNEQKSSKK